VALLIYSFIPYKTPWLVINLVLPLGLLGGYAVGAGLEAAVAPRLGAATLLLLLVAAAGSAARAVDLAILRPDEDGASPLIYVQTKRDALRLVARLEEYASRDPAGRRVSIAILSPDYLPLNWYLRDFPNVGYFGHLIDPTSSPLVICRSEDSGPVRESLVAGYSEEGYDLRPGVRLALFLKEPPGGGL
jgi:predicted membrane-bound mannosyltransferase